MRLPICRGASGAASAASGEIQGHESVRREKRDCQDAVWGRFLASRSDHRRHVASTAPLSRRISVPQTPPPQSACPSRLSAGHGAGPSARGSRGERARRCAKHPLGRGSGGGGRGDGGDGGGGV
eukprot:364884-Chlamydomonas_euryale.AAC.1